MSTPYGKQSASHPAYPAGGATMPASPVSGWTLFAAVMVGLAGLFNVLYGLVGVFWTGYLIGTPVGGPVWVWAIVWLAFGVVQVAAAFAIAAARAWGRWFGIAIVGLNLLLNVTAIALYPWWSLVIIAIDLLVIYGLTAGWRRTAVAS